MLRAAPVGRDPPCMVQRGAGTSLAIPGIQHSREEEMLRAPLPQVQLCVPTHPSRQDSCRPLLLLPSFPPSSEEAPALEPAIYWAPVGTHLPFPSTPTKHWRRGPKPPTSAATCHHHLVPEPGQGSRAGPGARGQLASTLRFPSAPALTLFCMATFRRAVKHSDELNNTRQCTV